jgi:NADH-quinone oxidoreductase subunit F
MTTPADRLEQLRSEARERVGGLMQSGRPIIRVGTATCGRSAGALDLADAFRQALEKHEVDAEVVEVGCMGHCYAEPMAVVEREGYPPVVYHHLNPFLADSLVRNFLKGEHPLYEYVLGGLEEHDLIPALSYTPRYGMEHRQLLERAGWVDPFSIHHAIALGGWSVLPRALEMDPQRIIDEVRLSGLRGMGGAGFPTWRKWALAREQSEPRYLVCNADEGDPGAFMDRTLIESDPHTLLEGMAIAAYAIGVQQGFVYVRAEYPLAVEVLRHAVRAAREWGLLGADVLGSGFAFDVEIAQGAGAFVCGESSALMYSIEGRRGMPRVRPPRSAEVGLFGRPTVLNNVKTLASVPRIVGDGGEAFASVGTEGSKGTAVFALAGKIANTGLVEVPMGTSLRDLVETIGGGVPDGKGFKAVQIGGPSGGCLPDSQLDVAIDFDALDAAGAMMGSGGMVVLDEDNCMVETARFFLEFTQRESCGKCTFCRIGTHHMLRLLTDITEGRGTPEHLEQLEVLAADVTDGSLCNLGKTAPNPVLTTLRFFREEYEAHIHEQRCPAGECHALMAYYIDLERCARACDACVGSCPVEAIFTNRKRLKVIDQSLCVKCNACMEACPPEYDAVVKISPLRDLPPQEPRPEDEKKLKKSAATAPADSKADSKADSETEAGAEADSKTEASAEADSKTEASAEADSKTEAGAEADSKTEASAEADSKTEASAEADSKTEASAEAEAEAGPRSAPGEES